MKRILFALVLAMPVLTVGTGAVLAQGHAFPPAPPAGSVSRAEGLAAWQRVEAVVTHPRCANCHVGPDNIPMWTVVGENRTRAHGMNVNAGDSRIGAGVLACSTCHMTTRKQNERPHAAPGAGAPWQLAPVEFIWFGKTGKDICLQMKDPKRNGGRDAAGLLEHLKHEAEIGGFVPWSWNPGGGRSTPPGTFEDHYRDMAAWGAAGQPCPE